MPDKEVITCGICGKTSVEINDGMLTINETDHNFTGNWCFPCAMGLCSALLSSLPDDDQRAVIRVFVEDSTPTHDDIDTIVATDMAGLFALVNPDLYEAVESAGPPKKSQA